MTMRRGNPPPGSPLGYRIGWRIAGIATHIRWGQKGRGAAYCRRCERVLDRTYFGRLRGHDDLRCWRAVRQPGDITFAPIPRPCPKARGRRREEHAAREFVAGVYAPTGDVDGVHARCPGWREPTT